MIKNAPSKSKTDQRIKDNVLVVLAKDMQTLTQDVRKNERAYSMRLKDLNGTTTEEGITTLDADEEMKEG